MRVVVQRVSAGEVVVGGETVAAIGTGLVVFAGLEGGDTEAEVLWMAQKVAGLRVFEDGEGKMNLPVGDAGGAGGVEGAGAVLAVPNFTVAGACEKGRRPSFDGAMAPERARAMFDRFAAILRAEGLRVETGVFGAEMDVTLTSDGPVTFVIERRGGG